MRQEQIESIRATEADVVDFAVNRKLLVPTPRIPVGRQFKDGQGTPGPSWYLRFDSDNGLTTRFISNSRTWLSADFYLSKDMPKGWQNALVAVAWMPHNKDAAQEPTPELYFSPVRRNDYGDFEALVIRLGSIPEKADFFVPLKAWPVSMLRGKRIADALYRSVVQVVPRDCVYDFRFWADFFNDKGASLPTEAALAINTGLLHATPRGEVLEVKSTPSMVASSYRPVGEIAAS